MKADAQRVTLRCETCDFRVTERNWKTAISIDDDRYEFVEKDMSDEALREHFGGSEDELTADERMATAWSNICCDCGAVGFYTAFRLPLGPDDRGSDVIEANHIEALTRRCLQCRSQNLELLVASAGKVICPKCGSGPLQQKS